MNFLMMEPKKILLIEDEPDLAEPLANGLAEEGFEVEIALTGSRAIQRLSDYWDVIILDLNLPDIPGETILSNLKAAPDYPPVIVLSARGTLHDKLELFRDGCDDYVTKPYHFEELLGRVQALLRRSHRVRNKSNTYEDLTLDTNAHILNTPTANVVLTPKESSIVALLMKKPETIVSRREILHHAWGLKDDSETNFIGVHFHNLRRKFAEISREDWLRTIRSSGFVLCAPGKECHGS